ncbi:hypothetical protein ACX0MV_17505 [Pseudomonas borbori]
MNTKTLTALTFAGLFAVLGNAHATDNTGTTGTGSEAVTPGVGTPDGSTTGRGAGVNTGADQSVEESGMPEHDDNRGTDAGAETGSDMGTGSGTGTGVAPANRGDGSMQQ